MLLVAMLGWGFWRQRVAGWPAPIPQAARPLLLAGLPMTISVLANFATDWAATLSTSHFLGPEVTGQLRVALQVTALFNLINVAFDAMLGPQIAAAWRLEDRARVERICGLSTLGMVGMALPLFLLVMLAPEWILGLFGAEFRDGAPMLRILAVGQLIALAGGPVGTILIMSGHDRWLMISSLSSLAVLALLCLVAVPLLGPVGGAVAVAGTMLYRRVIAALVVRFALGLKLLRLR
jgi:O-antigen/teichoic acid export membrane protein